MKQIVFAFFTFSVLFIFTTACINEHEEKEPTTPEVAVGDTLPTFSVTMSDGTVLDNTMLKEKTSVLVFFNTTCPDCQHELPIINSLYLAHRDDTDFRLACIAREQGKDEISEYWQAHNLALPYSPQADKAVFYLFAHNRIPRIYISDKEGVVRYMHDDREMPNLPTLEGELADVRATLGD